MEIRGNKKGTMRRILYHDSSTPPVALDLSSEEQSKKIILLSYMRAGTTFVGSMFAKNDDIFYVFEPEWLLFVKLINNYEPLKYLDGKIRKPIEDDEVSSVVEETVANHLRCNLRAIDTVTLQSKYMIGAKYTAELLKCHTVANQSLSVCVDKAIETCRSKPVQSVKTVRLRMNIAENLLRYYSNLKIIYMIRDPRGIAQSRLGLNEFYTGNPLFTFGRVCADMLKDIEVLENMDSRLSSRVYPVLYEEIVKRPIEMVRDMYRFLQIPLPEKILKHVKDVTHSVKDGSYYVLEVHRKDSTSTAYSWRSKIAFKLARNIDQVCARVYQKTGYLPVKNETVLRNMTISLSSPFQDKYLQRFGRS